MTQDLVTNQIFTWKCFISERSNQMEFVLVEEKAHVGSYNTDYLTQKRI